MMIPLQSYVRRSRHLLRRIALDPRLYTAARAAGYVLAGFILSAASLGHRALPLAMALVCACRGWSAVLTALGGAGGYLLFWGAAGYQPAVWVAAALPCVLFLSDKRLSRQTPLLLPATAALIVAAAGVIFQIAFMEAAPVAMYILRVVLGGAAAWLFDKVLQGRNPILDWLAMGLAVLALAQIAPIPWLGLGYIAAGMMVPAGAFPAAALAGLALDLAQVTQVPMTAVLTFGFLIRFLPRYPRWLSAVSPAMVYIGISGLVGTWDVLPLPGLLLGGILGLWLPLPGKAAHRRGDTGVAQVRLEMAAGVLCQTQQLLSEAPEVPVDEDALVERAAERACGGCAYRKSCKDVSRIGQTSPVVLHKSLLGVEELPIVCRKSGRFLAELHRSQEQLRSIRADRQRQTEYRAAVSQQYAFLADFLQSLSDQLARRTEQVTRLFEPEVTVCGNRPEGDNGDRCLRFAGVGSKYYVLLCDGMGTGPLAVAEGRRAATLLQRMLCAGYPAEHALRSLNSLCALRDRAGAATIDLAELMLDSGRVNLFKWGAAPSYLVTDLGADKIGSVSPPPGLSVTDDREQVEHLSLRRGEWLVMVSDGVGESQALSCCTEKRGRSPRELGADMLSHGQLGGQDDATVVIVRLRSGG